MNMIVFKKLYEKGFADSKLVKTLCSPNVQTFLP